MEAMDKKEQSQKANNVPDKKELPALYLAALLQLADWVSVDYKRLVNKAIPVESLRAIYLCACDGISVDDVKKALAKKDAVVELSKLRDEQLQLHIAQKYEEELAELQLRVQQAEEKIIEQEHKLKNVPKFGTKRITAAHKENIFKTDANTKKTKCSREKRFGFHRRSNSAMLFLSGIVKDYNAEQLEFIVDCIEEGVPINCIRKFISPVLPVSVMERLKRLEF